MNRRINRTRKFRLKKRNRNNSFKSLLTRNKIYFDTITAFLLSLMAIIISLAQILIAHKQNELSKYQINIIRQQVIPQFVINERQVMDEAEKKVIEHKIYVDNEGAIVFNLSSSVKSFIELEFSYKDKYKQIEIPISGYYDMTRHRGSGKGRLLTIEGYRNYDKFFELLLKYRELAQRKAGFGNIEIRHYLCLTYKDILGNSYSQYYKIDLFHGGIPIDLIAGKRIYKKHFNSFQSGKLLQFHELTAKKLFNIIVSETK